MVKPDFSDAEAKLDRARNHIADVKARIRSFLSTDFYRLRLKSDERVGRVKIAFDSLHQLDKSTDTLVGDAVGNLRSTLDYITVALARPITGKTDGTGFPFADDANGFAGAVRSPRCLGPCDIAIQDLFIKKIQAYEGGNGHSLWVLNKLRNIDKHRLLLASLKIAGVTASWRTRDGGIFTNCGIGVDAGESGTFLDMPMDYIEFTDQPRPLFEVTLTESPYVYDAPVAALLDSFACNVQSVLNSAKIGI